MRKLLLAGLMSSIVATPALAQRCKYEVETDAQLESKLLIIFRGGTVGLAGYFGVLDGRPYLRGSYASQFRAKAEFTSETPLELLLANGDSMTISVNTTSEARLRFFGAALNNRQAEPIFSLTRNQFEVLANTAIVGLTMNFIVEGEAQSTQREVKPKHAERIAEAITCLLR